MLTERHSHQTGFTLIEVMTVLVIIGILVGITVPLVMHSVERARESALRENLQLMRKALDDHYADQGIYPQQLDQLVEKRYLRKIPLDSVHDSRKAEWDLVLVAQPDGTRGIQDIKSLSKEEASDGSPYSSW